MIRVVRNKMGSVCYIKELNNVFLISDDLLASKMMKFLVLFALVGLITAQSSTYPPKTNPPPPTTQSAAPPSTTQGSVNPLSNSDGTPCNCNKATMWLDLIFVVDRSKSIGVGGVGAVSYHKNF